MAEAKKLRSEASTSGGGGGGESVVIDVGRRRSTCGYCKSGARTSISHGLWVNSLTVDHYQAILPRWVLYNVAKPFLDKRKYEVLSDLSALPKGDSVALNVIDTNMEEQQNEFIQETTNDVLVDNNEMEELEYEDSDDESDSEASGGTIVETGDADVSKVLIGLKETRLRYEGLRHAFDSSQRTLFESQLQRYTRVVGTELSEQMVYSLG